MNQPVPLPIGKARAFERDLTPTEAFALALEGLKDIGRLAGVQVDDQPSKSEPANSAYSEAAGDQDLLRLVAADPSAMTVTGVTALQEQAKRLVGQRNRFRDQIVRDRREFARVREDLTDRLEAQQTAFAALVKHIGVQAGNANDQALLDQILRVMECYHLAGVARGESGYSSPSDFEDRIFNEARLYEALGKEDARSTLALWKRYRAVAEAIIAHYGADELDAIGRRHLDERH
jgi:hypothetical protein